MFTETHAMFLYCTSPVHMGAGTAVGGLIDNPIQRERHTAHPLFAGSGLKGAVRHRFWAGLAEGDRGRKTSLVNRIFGPEKDASDHAGAVSFSDAQLVAFPVRSLTRAYVYATCPTALARTRRQLAQAGLEPDWEAEGPIETGRCRVTSKDLLAEEYLRLESFRMQALPLEESENLRQAAGWLGETALPVGPAHEFFRQKFSTDLVLLSDEEFGFFVRNATVVEPHVRINDVSGTADEGGLFYTENLPPESLLLSLLMASGERGGKTARPEGAALLTAAEVIERVAGGDGNGLRGIDGDTLQVGGDATTGRGMVAVRIARSVA